jgi:hypothetical protein
LCRFLEVYWDDRMIVQAAPFPVIAVRQMAEELLSRNMLESVLDGFPAGRHLVEKASLAVRRMGLSSSASAVDAAVETAQPTSWYDLALSHPAAVLGVLLLSRPDMPLGAFLRAAAARGAAVVPAAAVPMQRQSQAVDDVEAVSGDVEGGRVWGHGQLTAVGAGDAGNGGSWSLFVPVWEAREGDSRPGVVPVREEGTVRAGSRVSLIKRLGAVVGMLFGGRK